MQKKYELTDEVKDLLGAKLHRIRALVDIPMHGVKAGGLGGWVWREVNLSHKGNAWVSGNAHVYGNARVSGNALAYGSSLAYGSARVYGCARISASARVYGSAHVYGDALAYGNALVYGDARVYGSAHVSGNALVYGNARATRTPKVLSGFEHVLTVTDHHVRSGCEQHPPSVWAERGAAILEANGVSSADAKVQAEIINLIAAQHGCTDLEEAAQ